MLLSKNPVRHQSETWEDGTAGRWKGGPANVVCPRRAYGSVWAAQSLGNAESRTSNEMRRFSVSNLTSPWLRFHRSSPLVCAGAFNRVHPRSFGGGDGSVRRIATLGTLNNCCGLISRRPERQMFDTAIPTHPAQFSKHTHSPSHGAYHRRARILGK
jgi:hypothetical protein